MTQEFFDATRKKAQRVARATGKPFNAGTAKKAKSEPCFLGRTEHEALEETSYGKVRHGEEPTCRVVARRAKTGGDLGDPERQSLSLFA